MKKVMLVFGTRPEAIKMCPLVNVLKKHKDIETKVCVTGQHREMLISVLNAFDVKPDYNLDIMKDKQTLFDVTTSILEKIKSVLEKEKPDLVLVHGDTSTAFVTALACFYLRIKVGHVEAGLRTYNLDSPFPEELNRQGISLISAINFAPTELAKEHLLNEGKDPNTIVITGNTAIDALKTTVKKDYTNEYLDWGVENNSKLILLTAHRRENLGEPMRNMFRAIKRIVEEFEDVRVIYPIHMNPVVRQTAQEILGDNDRIKLIPPLDVLDFHNFLAKAHLVLTDSGGIQEEAPGLGKPVLVMRDTTERPEGIKAGTLKLVGTNEEKIYKEFKNLLENKEEYDKMSKASNPYGDGFACEKIVKAIDRYFAKQETIPKKIHYIWIGGNKKPESVEKYIESWKKHCPDYEIIEWNESNFDMNENQYIKEAYEAKKFAFVTDYMRLAILKREGGIYVDTDLEITQNIDKFLHYDCFSGFENGVMIPTALFGAKKGCKYIDYLLSYYDGRSFYINGKPDLTTNVVSITVMTKLKYDLKLDNSLQVLHDEETGEDIAYFPSTYFCTKDYVSGKILADENTYSIHHYRGSWLEKKNKIEDKFVAGVYKVFGEKIFRKMMRKFLNARVKKYTKVYKKYLKKKSQQ